MAVTCLISKVKERKGGANAFEAGKGVGEHVWLEWELPA